MGGGGGGGGGHHCCVYGHNIHIQCVNGSVSACPVHVFPGKQCLFPCVNMPDIVVTGG